MKTIIRMSGRAAAAAAFSVAWSWAASAAPLRVCADPNNMPFTSKQEAGFENKIVDLIAKQMQMQVQWVWRAQREGFLRNGLNDGRCDLVSGVPSATFEILTTRPYYRSTYVFVTRKNEPPVSSLDDPSLRIRKIGVELIGDQGMNTPPADALAARGIADNVRGYTVYGDYRDKNPASRIVRAVATGDIDVAAVWGPLAGYFAKRESIPLTVTPIETKPTDRIPETFDISMGVRKTDPELGDKVAAALDDEAPEIRRILTDYGVPLVGPPAAP